MKIRKSLFSDFIIYFFRRIPNRMTPLKKQLNFLELITPEDSKVKILKIGGEGDGSYFVPDDLKGIAECISPGFGNISKFEDELYAKYMIPSLIIDPEIPYNRNEKHLNFIAKNLGGCNTSETISLNRIMQDRMHEYILQIDIEGSEFESLIALDEDNLVKFRIIVIEFHGLNFIVDDFIISRILFPIFEKIDKYFYVCVLKKSTTQTFTNGDIRLPDTIEITFHRRDRTETTQSNFNWDKFNKDTLYPKIG